MGLVALGLVWLILRIAWTRSNIWLINLNGVTLLTVLMMCAFINLGSVIAKFNVEHCKEVKGKGPALDLKYLGEIGTASLPASDDENLLVGLEAPDDSAVYSLGDGRLLVASVDFFTPVVDDPEDFGAIAAANALSDLYAMGATPAFALSVLAVSRGDPVHGRGRGHSQRGAAATCEEAGIVIAGGTRSMTTSRSLVSWRWDFAEIAIACTERRGPCPGTPSYLARPWGRGIISTALKPRRGGRYRRCGRPSAR